jgi:hypothetical protein
MMGRKVERARSEERPGSGDGHGRGLRWEVQGARDSPWRKPLDVAGGRLPAILDVVGRAEDKGKVMRRERTEDRKVQAGEASGPKADSESQRPGAPLALFRASLLWLKASGMYTSDG